jgi:tetratricopeptide (TPR) repeat protein
MLTERIKQLKRLPRHDDETWQGGWARLYAWVADEDHEPFRPRLGIWYATEEQLFCKPDVCHPDEATPARAVERLISFAEDPDFGGYIPGRVEVQDSELADYLKPLLSELDIEVDLKDRLEVLEVFPKHLAESESDQPLPPGPLSGKGVTLKHMQRFADAAKAFYEAEPWQHLTDEDLIHIESPKAPTGMKCVAVLGTAGQAFGLGFFGKAQECWDMHRLDSPPDWVASRRSKIWSLTFDPITETPFDDVDLWEDHQLPVAGVSAYPCILGYSSSRKVTRPDAARLTYVEGLLRALAQTSEQQMDSGRWSVTVETKNGPTEYSLSIPDVLDPPHHQELMNRGFQPDRRAMEKMHAQMDRFLEGKEFDSLEAMNAAIANEFTGKSIDEQSYPARTPLERAQDVCFDAFDSFGRRQLQLAREALSICPDCADAYVLLAERTGDVEKAIDLYAQGVTAGERALGPERFKQDVGEFWGQTDTRPYMRARLGLAQCLQQTGRLAEAADHYRELLRLNPGDNQGVRYLYLPLSLQMGRDAEVAQYMDDAEEEATATWSYIRALLAYRHRGDCDASRKALRQAIETNRHVITYLQTDLEPPQVPDRYQLGSVEEAIVCTEQLGSAFESTPGARDWLRTQGRTFSRAASSQTPTTRRNDRTNRRKQRAKERKRKRR